MSRKWNPSNTKNLIKRYLAGEAEYSIANSCGVARGTFRRMLLDHGIRFRAMREAQAVRYSKTTIGERKRQVAAANSAMRGSKRSLTALKNHAFAVQRIGRMNEGEKFLHDLLTERGLKPTPQLAIGPYNCDLGISPVAVEIFGGSWHSTPKRLAHYRKRTRYLLNAGWHVLIIIVDHRFPITPTQADYVVAYVKQARSNPAMIREYRMIRGAVQVVALGSVKDKNISLISTFTNRRDPSTGRYKSVAR